MKHLFSLFVSILHLLCVNACVKWTIISPPIVFGETGRLGCKLENYTPNMTREWSGGPNNVPLVFNGITNYPWKYRETTSTSAFNSILNIFHFSENDVGVDYACYIGDHKDKHLLLLNEQHFEYHPQEDTTAVAISLRVGHMHIEVTIPKVYPEPKCQFIFQETDISYSSKIYIKKSGKLFCAKLSLDHEMNTCRGELKITCQIGKSNISIYKSQIHNCQGQGQTNVKEPSLAQSEGTGSKTHMEVSVSFVVITSLLLLIGMIILARTEKFRDAICCIVNHVNWRGEQRKPQNAPAVLKRLRSVSTGNEHPQETGLLGHEEAEGSFLPQLRVTYHAEKTKIDKHAII